MNHFQKSLSSAQADRISFQKWRTFYDCKIPCTHCTPKKTVTCIHPLIAFPFLFFFMRLQHFFSRLSRPFTQQSKSNVLSLQAFNDKTPLEGFNTYDLFIKKNTHYSSITSLLGMSKFKSDSGNSNSSLTNTSFYTVRKKQ